MDSPTVKETIETYGITAIAVEMDLPISTVATWKYTDAIPGKGTLHDMRVRAFKAAIKSLKRKIPKAA